MKIIYVSKNKRRSIYSVDKKQEFWNSARELLKKFSADKFYLGCFGYEDDEMRTDKDISKIKDINVGSFLGEGFSVDFIAGESKVFIIFSYEKDLQQKISEIIYSVFEE